VRINSCDFASGDGAHGEYGVVLPSDRLKIADADAEPGDGRYFEDAEEGRGIGLEGMNEDR
jgi:hypothetical protein